MDDAYCLRNEIAVQIWWRGWSNLPWHSELPQFEDQVSESVCGGVKRDCGHLEKRMGNESEDHTIESVEVHSSLNY